MSRAATVATLQDWEGTCVARIHPIHSSCDMVHPPGGELPGVALTQVKPPWGHVGFIS